jgi:hypothetical protein
MLTSVKSKQVRARTSSGVAAFAPQGSRTKMLSARILDAFRAGRAVEWSPPPTGPTAERVETEEKTKLQLGRMTAGDRAAIVALSAPREQALALARVSRLDEADTHMSLARFLLSLSRLSPEGRAYASTMHEAAESYLAYQRRDYASAYSRMIASLEATDRLADSWGNTEFIVCRRVDLAHNLMRVEMRRGATRDAMRRGTGLLQFVCRASAKSRHVESGEVTDASLHAFIATALFDLVMGTIAELVAPLPAHEARAVLSSLDWLQAPNAAPSPRAVEWLAIKNAALGADPERFVDAALPFLKAGRGKTATLWYAVALDLARLIETLDPVAGADALDEIAAELSTASRVPVSMRMSPRLPLETLRAAAFEAFREGRNAAWSAPMLDVAQVQLEDHLGRLPLADRRGLETLAEHRERALTLARQGRQVEAAASMKLAGLVLSAVRFSREGQAFAMTLHHAAESYLSFRRGEHADAHANMVAALRTTDELGGWWGNSQFIVCRRVHLLHNLMRVEVARGAANEAMQLGARLVEYLCDSLPQDSETDSCAPDTRRLDARLVEHFFNLVMETVAELVATLPADEARDGVCALSRARAPEARPAWRGWDWVEIKSAALGRDPRRFLGAAVSFLRAGRMATPVLWYAVALDLARTYSSFEPEAARQVVDEIASELATAPKVPTCMRRTLSIT